MRSPIAADGLPILAVLALVTLAAYLLNPWAALLPAALLALSLWFFRDPERPIPGEAGLVVAPADGRVMYVREVEEPRFVAGRAQVISIFLSILDVHVNRSPVAGEVTYYNYVRGRFIAAWDEKVHEVNERAYIGLEVQGRRVLVVQIAGLLARRIVTRCRVGDRLERGQRFGLIKFGSCTQLYLPADAQVLVRAGDRVKGGETVVGRLPADG